MPASRRRWRDMSPTQRLLMMLLAVAQVSLAITAWVDLARRPTDQINGDKRWWAAVIAVNFVGPLAYFRRGRRPAG
jgi:hypothetical protein